MQPQQLSPPPPHLQLTTPLALAPPSPLPPSTLPRRQAGRFPNDTARYYAAQVTLVRSPPSHPHGMSRTHPVACANLPPSHSTSPYPYPYPYPYP